MFSLLPVLTDLLSLGPNALVEMQPWASRMEPTDLSAIRQKMPFWAVVLCDLVFGANNYDFFFNGSKKNTFAQAALFVLAGMVGSVQIAKTAEMCMWRKLFVIVKFKC